MNFFKALFNPENYKKTVFAVGYFGGFHANSEVWYTSSYIQILLILSQFLLIRRNVLKCDKIMQEPDMKITFSFVILRCFGHLHIESGPYLLLLYTRARELRISQWLLGHLKKNIGNRWKLMSTDMPSMLRSMDTTDWSPTRQFRTAHQINLKIWSS